MNLGAPRKKRATTHKHSDRSRQNIVCEGRQTRSLYGYAVHAVLCAQVFSNEGRALSRSLAASLPRSLQLRPGSSAFSLSQNFSRSISKKYPCCEENGGCPLFPTRARAIRLPRPRALPLHTQPNDGQIATRSLRSGQFVRLNSSAAAPCGQST